MTEFLIPGLDAAQDFQAKFFYSNPGLRYKIPAPRTLYVRSGGSDGDTGQSWQRGAVNIDAGALATLQRAIDVAAGADSGVSDITIDGNGLTFTSGITLRQAVGGGRIIITNCTIASTYRFENVAFSASSGSAIIANASGLTVQIGTGCTFGACPGGLHLYAGAGAQIQTQANYTISGGAQIHAGAYDGGFIGLGAGANTNTLTGTPSFSAGFAVAQRGGRILSVAQTYSGAATGTRHNAALGGQITVTPFSSTYFPGDIAGSVDSGTFGLFAAA